MTINNINSQQQQQQQQQQRHRIWIGVHVSGTNKTTKVQQPIWTGANNQRPSFKVKQHVDDHDLPTAVQAEEDDFDKELQALPSIQNDNNTCSSSAKMKDTSAVNFASKANDNVPSDDHHHHHHR
jgi:hypothetical protein